MITFSIPDGTGPTPKLRPNLTSLVNDSVCYFNECTSHDQYGNGGAPQLEDVTRNLPVRTTVHSRFVQCRAACAVRVLFHCSPKS